MRDDGFASPLMLALLALAALVCLVTIDAANVLLSRARAQSAADAAALAAAAAQWRSADRPEEEARRIAESNGARLVVCDCAEHEDRAVVTVSRRTSIRMLGVAPADVRASAVAQMDVGRLFEPP